MERLASFRVLYENILAYSPKKASLSEKDVKILFQKVIFVVLLDGFSGSFLQVLQGDREADYFFRAVSMTKNTVPGGPAQAT